MSDDLIQRMTGYIMTSYAARHTLSISEIGPVTRSISQTLNDLLIGAPPPPVPAVPISRSITNDYLICLDDGRACRVLTGHIRKLGMTPAQYRAKWGLPADYPMSAPSMTEMRSQLTREMWADSNRAGREEAVIEPASREEIVEAETAIEADQPDVTEATAEGSTISVEAINDAVEVLNEVLASEDRPVENIVQPAPTIDFLSTFSPDAILCLVDDKFVKDLGRHLRRHHGLSAVEYRSRFGLPETYPMTFAQVEGFLAKFPA
jgi:predicted transcriptional regulator